MVNVDVQGTVGGQGEPAGSVTACERMWSLLRTVVISENPLTPPPVLSHSRLQAITEQSQL
jgi:hypothetical protein